MSLTLPKITIPTFELIQPSTQKKIIYRPFLVKEEKILLMARESDDKTDMFRAITQVVRNCVQNEDFNVDDIPLYDLEYIFIQLRAKSVDNIVHFTVTDSDDGQTYELQLDLNDVTVKFPEKMSDGIIPIHSKLKLKMKHPTASIANDIRNLKTVTDVAYQLAISCIECVFDDENVYPWNQVSLKDKQDFIDMFMPNTYKKIQEFLENMPKVEHTITYVNANGVEKKVVFRNLDDFFTLY